MHHILGPLVLLVFFYMPKSFSQVISPSIFWEVSNEAFLQGNYCEAVDRILDYEKKIHSYSPDWISSKLLLAASYLELEELDKVKETVFLLENLGLKPEQTGRWLLLKSRLKFMEQGYAQADSLFRITKRYIQQNLGANSPLLGEAFCFHGWLQLESNQFKTGTESLEQAKRLLSGTKGRFLQISAFAYSLSGFFYQEQSELFLAENNFQQSKLIWEENGWTQHPNYGLLLNDYALLLLKQGQLVNGDSLLNQSYKIIKNECLIPTRLAYHYNSRAVLEKHLQDYKSSKEFYQQAIELFDKKRKYKEVAMALGGFGNVLFLQDSLELAEKVYLEALEQLDKSLPDALSLTKATLLDGLASINDYQSFYEKADSLYQEEETMLQQLIGKENIRYATALNNRAAFKEYNGMWQEAEILFKESLKITEKFLGNKHPDYLTTLYNLARLQSKISYNQKANANYKKANALQLKILNNYFSDFDENTRLDYRLSAMGNFDAFLNYACFQDNPELSIEVLNFNLATKNLVLDYAIQTQDLEVLIKDEQIREIWKRWKYSKNQLTRTYSMSEFERKQFGRTIDELQKEIDLLERRLIRSFPNRFQDNLIVNFETIKNHLAPDEIAIDFFNFSKLNEFGDYTDTMFYFASIVRSDWEYPKLIFLTDNMELENLFDNYNHYTTISKIGYLLHQKIWQPLASYLEGIHNVHLSPDGLLHQVSFGGVFTDNIGKETLLDNYDIFYHSNLADMVQKSNTKLDEGSILLMGNPDYDSVSSSENSFCIPNDSVLTDIEYFFPLEGTEKELDTVWSIANSHGWKTIKYIGTKASEHHFRQSKSPTIIHLSTHGFFLKYSESADANSKYLGERYKASTHPLLHSGLAFAGINCTWSGGQMGDIANNGILTAQEVTDLDFSNTQLVVLSACETGRGSVSDGEGVFGLQRAFKIAGVNQLLISLWKVSDQTTAELMKYFYKFLLEGDTPSLSLLKSQRQLKEQGYPPYYWAGFVIFE